MDKAEITRIVLQQCQKGTLAERVYGLEEFGNLDREQLKEHVRGLNKSGLLKSWGQRKGMVYVITPLGRRLLEGYGERT